MPILPTRVHRARHTDTTYTFMLIIVHNCISHTISLWVNLWHKLVCARQTTGDHYVRACILFGLTLSPPLSSAEAAQSLVLVRVRLCCFLLCFSLCGDVLVLGGCGFSALLVACGSTLQRGHLRLIDCALCLGNSSAISLFWSYIMNLAPRHFFDRGWVREVCGSPCSCSRLWLWYVLLFCVSCVAWWYCSCLIYVFVCVTCVI